MKKNEIKVIPFFLTLFIIVLSLKKEALGQHHYRKPINQHFGLFFHYLYSLQNTLEPWNQKKITSWDDCVNDFNVDILAQEVKDIGAGYVIFTTGQIDRYFCFPNTVYENLTSYPRGLATSHRDLIRDLYYALHKRGIKLFLYATGDGPRADVQASVALHNPSIHPNLNEGNPFKVNDEWVNNWSVIIKSISLQYKKKVSGWWFDGCYNFIGYNKALLMELQSAAKSGNPNAIVALNNGPTDKVQPYIVGDYTAGESDNFIDTPSPYFAKNSKVKWHILSYLGSKWAQPGIRFSKDYLKKYIYKIKSLNGMITIDACLLRDGTIDNDQYLFLKNLNY